MLITSKPPMYHVELKKYEFLSLLKHPAAHKKWVRFSNLSKSPCLVNFDNLYTAQLLSCLEVIPLPLSITATAGFPCVSSKCYEISSKRQKKSNQY